MQIMIHDCFGSGESWEFLAIKIIRFVADHISEMLPSAIIFIESVIFLVGHVVYIVCMVKVMKEKT